AIGQTERLEHLDGATGDSVGLAHLEWTVLAVDDRGPDLGEVAHLRRQDQAGRSAPDDQHVDLLSESCRPLRNRRVRLLDQRVTGLITVEIELHRFSSRSTGRAPAAQLKSPRVRPPSTSSVTPVMYAASVEQRKAAAEAISSGEPKRRRGIVASSRRRASSGSACVEY